MDAVIRNFWWGHEQGIKKLHMTHWDKLCRNKKEGGLGFKKFNLMNQTMLAKQFWRISHNPQSLLAKTFKAKCFPHCSVHECVPKPHHFWFWRNLIKYDNQKLRKGRWWIGNGRDISLEHSDWFNCPDHNLQNPNLITGKVADLINHNTREWKADLVRSIYTAPQCSKILSIPISKTEAVSDKILWKHSTTSQFDVRTAYKILHKDEASKFLVHDSSHQIQTEVWQTIWKVRTPHKVNLFVWKLMQDCLPTFLALKNRGICHHSTCPFCNEEEESTSHLFLRCTFNRACWHGSTLAIHTSDFNDISV